MKIFLLILVFMLTTGIPAAYAQKSSLVTDTVQAAEWFKQGMKWQRSRQNERANVLFAQAAALYRKHRLWDLQFHCDNQLARGLFHMVRYEEALQVTSQIIRESTARLGKDNKEEANAYHVNALIYNDIGEHDKALAANRQTLRIRVKIRGENNKGVANSYNNIGQTYAYKGNYNKALENYRQSLRIRVKVMGEAHPYVAVSYKNIANILERIGEYEKSMQYYEKAFDIWLQNQGKAPSDVPFAYHGLGGNVYFKKGEYDKALEYYQKTLETMRIKMGEVHEEVAHMYVYIGRVYYKKGEYDLALANYQKTLQIRRQLFGEVHAFLAESYTSIGEAYQQKGAYDQALEAHGKALQIRQQSLIQNNSLIAASFNHLGTIYQAKGEDQKALRQYQQAIRANISSFKDTSISQNPVLTHKANAYLDGKTLFWSMHAKAACLERLSSRSRALPDLLLAYRTYCSTDTLAQQIQHSYGGERDQITFVTVKAVVAYQKALPLCLELYNLMKDPAYLASAFSFAERGKASVLSATLAESKAITFAGIPDSLLQQAQGFRTRAARYTQKIAEELAKGKGLDSSKLKGYQTLLFAIHRQQEDLVSSLEKDFPHYFSLKYQRATITPAQLQGVLNDQTAVLEYVLGDTLLHQFLLTRRSFEVRSIPLDKIFRRQITAFRTAILDRDEDLFQQVGRELSRLLLPPSLPKSIRHLILIPGEELATLPFEALPSQHTKARSGKTQAYLLQQYAVSYAYSARLLYERLTQTAEPGSKQLLAMAPVFADTPAKPLVTSTRSFLTDKSAARGNNELTATSSDSLYMSFKRGAGPVRSGSGNISARQLSDTLYVAPLLASQREVETIATLFRAKGAGAQVYLHGQAREDKLKNKDLSGYTYLHLATHGFVNEDYPELSGLLLAQDSTSREDGILYSGEIYNLRLKADLVTLSACETGLGKIAPGEGIIGLSRALLYAGAQNVIVSLWKVYDVSTADLMEHFYKGLLQGQDKAQALQAAKQHLIRQGKYDHPYYWAPFILIGK